jgi:hypothetical protein
MPTIDQLKKQYDKLTAPERFALMIAAAIREDKAEERALEASAPKVNWEFPHTIGLTFGFRQLVKNHLINVLGWAGSFFMLMYMSEDANAARRLETIEAEEIPTGEAVITLTARRFLEGVEAFRTVCREYNIDPAAMEEIYNPFPMLSLMMEVIARKGFEMASEELTDLEQQTAEYRGMIEGSREHWAENKAR